MATILIVDDDKALRESLEETVAALGHRPLSAASGSEALARLQRQPVEAVLLDLHLPDMNGIEVLRRLREKPKRPLVVILTAFASAANTIEAMRLGAFDHLTKPIGRDDLDALLQRMLPRAQPARTADVDQGERETLVGSSEAMRRVQKTIGLATDSDATVLVLGETGTGKELVARALHEHGRRKAKPFIAVNCAAIPGDLLESELFGHLKGAFTGATSDRMGAFREANGGTLLLDEIGDMPPAMQAKILRVLQDQVVMPVGGRPAAVDVRVIAATHRDLTEWIAEGRFREDLYYRLNIVRITLPPLRERLADILPLAEHFLRAASASGVETVDRGGCSTTVVAQLARERPRAQERDRACKRFCARQYHRCRRSRSRLRHSGGRLLRGTCGLARGRPSNSARTARGSDDPPGAGYLRRQPCGGSAPPQRSSSAVVRKDAALRPSPLGCV
jgi:DNA-binding NtrC family response regulator